MSVEWMQYKGKRILKVNYSGLNEQEMIKQLHNESDLIMKEKEPVLYLGIFHDAIVTSDFMKVANERGKETEKKTARSSVLGMTTGMRKILLNTYCMFTGSKMRAFSTETECLEHLVK